MLWCSLFLLRDSITTAPESGVKCRRFGCFPVVPIRAESATSHDLPLVDVAREHFPSGWLELIPAIVSIAAPDPWSYVPPVLTYLRSP
jgi:hypothetical protein